MIIIWFAGVLISCCLTGFFFMNGGAGGTELPGAVLKVVVPPGSTLQKTFDLAENAILSQGYKKQPYSAYLTSQSYTKDDFEISYDPYDEAQITLDVVYLHYYEHNWGEDLFSKAGIAEYGALSKALSSVGLQPVPEDQSDRDNARWAATPEMFNARRGPQLAEESIMGSLLGVSGLLFYGFLIMWPVFWIFLKLLNYFTLPIWLKRILFITTSSLLLPPGFILLTPFGPAVFAPLPLALPFALLATPLLYPLAISIGCTMILASVVSLTIRSSDSSSPEEVKLVS